MKPFKQLFSDTVYSTGLIFIVLSLLWMGVPYMLPIPVDNNFGMFFGNFMFSLVYFIVLWASGRLRRGRNGLHPFFLFLILFLISAYSLNRQLNVFEASVEWFTALQMLLCVNYMAFVLFEKAPRGLQNLMCFLLGVGLMIFIYLSFYLVPLYAIGLAAALIIGISLHTFVPVLFCIYTIVLIRRAAGGNKQRWYSFAAGASFMLLITIAYTLQWNHISKNLSETYRKSDLSSPAGLPAWVTAAQKIPRGWMSERVLKADLVYSVPQPWQDPFDLLWRMPSRNFDEQKKHDPLVMVAALLTGHRNIPEDDRIKILESIYDSRHQAQDRLWSGDNLFTQHVKTDVKIWPQFCLSYTEKLITVTNSATRNTWRSEEEAIYTFHLPEGTVVTSLSLWIEGQESKGILTTKEKADSAYRTIVGVESRDPSVVHWQEGNTVSVRVFPVFPGKSRLFKLGFTSPLQRKDDKLIYTNVYFKGPSVSKALEDVSVKFETAPKDFIVPASFNTSNNTAYRTSGSYQAEWGVEMPREMLSDAAFHFNGNTYRVRPYQKQRVPATFKAVYLDINTTWTTEEFMKITALFKNKPVYVYDDGLKLLNDQNAAFYFDRLSNDEFSLFPLHEISDPANALLVTKSTIASPNLADLEGSRFKSSLKSYLQQGQAIRLFNLGHALSPYLKSLKEYRVFNYEQGNVQELEKLVASGTFATSIEGDARVVIDNAEVAIVREPGNAAAAAPDHLMRLFAYNHIMQKMGSSLITGGELNTALVDEAKEAYVVSPVSSLVVLESQKDYDRFNINESSNSLKNASLQSKGAVPEPHEWALIILAVLVLLYFRFQPSLRQAK